MKMNTKTQLWMHILLEFDWVSGDVRVVKKYVTEVKNTEPKEEPKQTKMPEFVGEVEL